MKPLMNEDFLLTTPQAKKLYAMGAGKLPVIDFHNHLSAQELYENRTYENLTQVWLSHDHYKWRLMRSCGIPEEYITGSAPDKEKYDRWVQAVSTAYGNPLYHWTHLELWRYFGIDEALTMENKDRIWAACNEALKCLPPRKLVEMQNVKLLCTTNDPAEDLKYHRLLADWKVQVVPAFRPDRALQIGKADFPDYIRKLMETAGGMTEGGPTGGTLTCRDILSALARRLDFFMSFGCRISDHSLEGILYVPCGETEADAVLAGRLAGNMVTAREAAMYASFMLLKLAGMYKARRMTMQLHMGALRNISVRNFTELGQDRGFDCISDRCFAEELSGLLSAMENGAGLPRTILYPLDPKAWTAVSAMAPCFCCRGDGPAHVQPGAAWWFNDHEEGITRQLKEYAISASLGNFAGMVTDSRSLLSFPRHEYFRRILCRLLGQWMAQGEILEDYDGCHKIVEAVCEKNAEEMFKL